MIYRGRSFVDLLRSRAESDCVRQAYVFLEEDGTEGDRLGYPELDRRARTIAARLKESVTPGERVLLLFNPGLDFIAAFFGCLYAGAIAVPVYPPRLNRSILRLEAVARDAQAAFALTNDQI